MKKLIIVLISLVCSSCNMNTNINSGSKATIISVTKNDTYCIYETFSNKDQRIVDGLSFINFNDSCGKYNINDVVTIEINLQKN